MTEGSPMGLIEAYSLAIAVRRHRLSYLGRQALVDLYHVAAKLDVPGDVVEAGTALAGSSAMLAAAISGRRRLHLYDTFGMIPPPTSADGKDVHDRYAAIVAGRSDGIGGDTYYGYRGDLRAHVLKTVRWADANVDVVLHQGLYEQVFWPPGEVALAHLDCDWYESVQICLERLWPRLSAGGRVVIDDYDEWSGARKAVDEFVAGHDVQAVRRARLHLLKPR